MVGNGMKVIWRVREGIGVAGDVVAAVGVLHYAAFVVAFDLVAVCSVVLTQLDGGCLRLHTWLV